MSPHERALHLVSTDEQATASGVRVAFASRDKRHIDQHFGSATLFLIFSIDKHQAVMTDAVAFQPAASGHDQGKIAERIAALAGCAAVYCLACGPSAARQLVQHSILPILVEPGENIRVSIAQLQQQMKLGACNWLAKALNPEPDKPGERLSQLLEEEW